MPGNPHHTTTPASYIERIFSSTHFTPPRPAQPRPAPPRPPTAPLLHQNDSPAHCHRRYQRTAAITTTTTSKNS
ncbi:hypothetical protein E2C01_064855 [Portunus trituberculatus]|uniref:Uncharacterized protein n=1 Tax=Portunus trituberculatus TaxID=210409 RepID=A0A5B7HCY3_PORTR|nr:hypothetical protein [Portunus trituberculatus]